MVRQTISDSLRKSELFLKVKLSASSEFYVTREFGVTKGIDGIG